MIKDFDPISIQLGLFLKKYHKRGNEINQERYLKKSIRIVEKHNPDILCVSSWSANLPFNIEFIRNFKSRNPNTTIIMGGHPATFVPEEILSLVPEIDFLVRGEGEYTFLELIGALVNEKNFFGNIKGLSYRNKQGKIVHTPNRSPIKNLDKLPLPDYSSFIKKGETFCVMSARGCMYSCKFCSAKPLEGRPERRKSVDRMKKEIEKINKDYIFFGCNNFTTNSRWVEKICEILKNSGKIWHCMSRVDTVNEDLLRKMERGGCEEISYGPESVAPRLLAKMGKITKSRVSEYIKLCWDIPLFSKKLGMKTRANVVIGFPYERKEELLKTLNYIVELKHKGILSHASTLSPYIGSDMWNEYVSGKYEIVRRGENHPKGFFTDKYDHLPWVFPDAWMFKNKYMSRNEFEKVVYKNWSKKVRSM